MRNTDTQITQAIQQYHTIPPEVAAMVRLATYDLFNGPISECDECGNNCTCEYPYPGFVKAIRVISDWADENVSTLWVDTDYSGVTDREPQAEEIDGQWEEPCWETIYQIPPREVLARLFGKTLAEYL